MRKKLVQAAEKPEFADDDPGKMICTHGDRDIRIHYLGGGIWVCFSCWAALFVGGHSR